MSLARLTVDITGEASAPAPMPRGRQALQCLSRAEASRDCVTNLHEALVSVVVEQLCTAIGVDKHHSCMIGEAAQLHDIGKFALPSDILHKPGQLSHEEWAIVRKHPEVGAGILRVHDDALLERAATVALYHHEHFDGGGYPHGLAGADIPFEARIVAVADVYEALRADRAYKRGVGHDEAVRIILQGDDRSKPTQFDPVVLDALVEAGATIAESYERTRSPQGVGEESSCAGDTK